MIRYRAFEYFATGEGFTYGIIVGTHRDETHNRMRFIAAFSDYYLLGSDYGTWDEMPDNLKKLLPDNIKKTCDRLHTIPEGWFEFHCQYHMNLS